MRNSMKWIGMCAVVFIATGAIKAQTYVETAPAGNQTITQPTDTYFKINGSTYGSIYLGPNSLGSSLSTGWSGDDVSEVILNAASGSAAINEIVDSGGTLSASANSGGSSLQMNSEAVYGALSINVVDESSTLSLYDGQAIEAIKLYAPDGGIIFMQDGEGYGNTATINATSSTGGNISFTDSASHTAYLGGNGTTAQLSVKNSSVLGAVLNGDGTGSTATSAASSTTNMFTMTDSSTASAPSENVQPGHALQVVTGSSSYLNPFAVYARTTPNTGETASNAAFEVTNGLPAGGAADPVHSEDAHLLISNFEYNSTATYGNAYPYASQFEMNAKIDGPGFNLGSSGTSAFGWTVGKLSNLGMTVTRRGINQLIGGAMDNAAQGDTDLDYLYLTAFGGDNIASDEAVVGRGTHVFQRGFISGTLTAGGTTGSTMITAGSLVCNGSNGVGTQGCQEAYSGPYFSDGGILLDTHTAGITATVVDCNAPTGSGFPCNPASSIGGISYDISGATVTASTAWGNIIPSSCTGNGNGQYQNYTSTTCNVTLGSGSGNFNTSSHIFLSGPFEEEAAITTAATPVSGVQSITFSTRYAWDNAYGNTNGALVMQGGPGGQSFIATASSGWPVAYSVVGATSSTQVYFSNCINGNCNGLNGTNIIEPVTPDQFSSSGSLVRTSNVVTFSGFGNSSNIPRINNFPVGSSIVLTGWSPSDLNGTFTVTSNTRDIYNPSHMIQWAQTGADESSSGTPGAVAQPAPQITFYPSAFIIGTDNGTQGVAQLGTNHVPFASGDTIVGSPTSEDQQTGSIIYQGQTTAVDGSKASIGYGVNDSGPSPMTTQYSAVNNLSFISPNMFEGSGSFSKYFNLAYRPANNGCILCVFGGDPVSGISNIPYTIFSDQLGGGNLTYAPATNTIAFSGRIAPQQSTPSSSSAACTAGQMWSDASYIYVCTATNTIKRAALSSF